MVNVLINLFSKQGDTILDPFSGSGVVPLETVLAERCALANDLSPYAFVLTKGKLEAPKNEMDALKRAGSLCDVIEAQA
ncbi:MAG: DNA adenine methylase, partial [Desulfobacterales bacterium]|nr:DNA adenine methylase [Desulfobacterales bacterium]